MSSLDRKILLCCPSERSNGKLEVVYRLPTNVRASVRRWQEAGTLELYVSGEYLCSYPLYYLEDIDGATI